MKGEHLITKLSPGSLEVGHIGGGTVKITSMDVAAGLAFGRLERGAYLYGMAVYAEDPSVIPELKHYATFKAFDLARHYRWKTRRGKPHFINTSCLAVDELISPHLGYCPACGGAGQVVNEFHVSIVCDKCEGSRNKKMSNALLGERIGCSSSCVDTTWRKRYNRIYQELMGWEEIVLLHLWEQFREAA